MKNAITVIIIVVVAVGTAWLYLYSRPLGVQVAPTRERGQALELVERMKKIKIDTSFFEDAQFLGFEAAQELFLDGLAIGRPNPFVPAGRR